MNLLVLDTVDLTYFLSVLSAFLTDTDLAAKDSSFGDSGGFALAVVVSLGPLPTPSRFMASMSAPYLLRCSSYFLIRARSSASGNLFLRLRGGTVAAEMHCT